MKDLKKCPLNNFVLCIGQECAFFIEPIKSKGAFLNNDLITDPSDIAFPCSISILGTLAFQANQPKPKEME